MKVGFFAQGDGEHLHIAKHLIRSVRQSMPDVEILHLTDGKTKALCDVRRIAEEMPMAVRRMTHHAELEGDWLFIDSDCIVRKDVSHVFDGAQFAVAVTDRKGSKWEQIPYAMVMPYNMGVTFSRDRRFWELVLKRLKTLPEAFQMWEGDQRVVCELVRRGCPAKVLPGRVYNFTPEKRGDSIDHAAIVHFKGRAKQWIGDYADHPGRARHDHSGSRGELENGSAD